MKFVPVRFDTICFLFMHWYQICLEIILVEWKQLYHFKLSQRNETRAPPPPPLKTFNVVDKTKFQKNLIARCFSKVKIRICSKMAMSSLGAAQGQVIKCCKHFGNNLFFNSLVNKFNKVDQHCFKWLSNVPSMFSILTYFV